MIDVTEHGPTEKAFPQLWSAH